MIIDPQNPIIRLCAQGMNWEGEGRTEEAREVFGRAWEESSTDFDRCIAAHYVARQQGSVSDKLEWDLKALHLALQINDPKIEGALPSLYLNVGKGYEDLSDFDQAKENYNKAWATVRFLDDNGYGHMIKNGILIGLERVR